ncbi:hypothetical protein [Prosthecobacter sp.]|uniref:hypothetical protein n=1 Tax=Prosthecobacter sp. TaxID=1965333 RepID=UPI0037844F01
MKRTSLLLSSVAAAVILSACETTSISNVGRNPFYRGEIAEADLLGIPANGSVTDAAIRATLEGASRRSVRLHPGEHILLIQSGSIQPDGALSRAFEQHVRVSPYSGLPQDSDGQAQAAKRPDPRVLRMAAARAGASKIVCVWGLLESAHDSTGFDSITWLPVVGEFIPGKRTVTRLTLKAMVMDTATGSWKSFSTDPITDKRVTAAITEDLQSSRQIEQMKGGAYAQLARRMTL